METKHTLYEWCLANNIQILDLEENHYDDYMLTKIDVDEYKTLISEFEVKENSTPRKPDKYLELKMYRLVPYNISDMQKGIQFDHAKDDYYNKYWDDERCKLFRTEWFTTIALNGGTSNEGHMVRHGFRETMYVGTMQQHLKNLLANDIKFGVFYEPDLNSMLTSINFIVDEKVFNKKLYPDFVPPRLEDETPEGFITWGKLNDIQYNNWVNKVGGPKNVFLREFLKDKKLA